MNDEARSDCAEQWTYVEIEVIDADRRLQPTHLCSTEIRFSKPPRFVAEVITITTRNGDRKTMRQARVLAHHPEAQHIPIQLIGDEQKASTRLTA